MIPTVYSDPPPSNILALYLGDGGYIIYCVKGRKYVQHSKVQPLPEADDIPLRNGGHGQETSSIEDKVRERTGEAASPGNLSGRIQGGGKRNGAVTAPRRKQSGRRQGSTGSA